MTDKQTKADMLDDYECGDTLMTVSQRYGVNYYDARRIINSRCLKNENELSKQQIAHKISRMRPPNGKIMCREDHCIYRRDGSDVCCLPSCFKRRFRRKNQ